MITWQAPRRSRRTIPGTIIAISLGASLAAIAALWPATVPSLITMFIAGVLLLGVLACLPRGK